MFWLRTPCGERFLSLGVNVINGGYPSRVFNDRLSYHWETFYPTLETWAATTRQRLLTWGFNTAGAWSVEPSKLPLPFIPDLELGREAEFHWFDPFHPAMEEKMRTWAHRLVSPYKGNPYRIGYFSDNEVGCGTAPYLSGICANPPPITPAKPLPCCTSTTGLTGNGLAAISCRLPECRLLMHYSRVVGK